MVKYLGNSIWSNIYDNKVEFPFIDDKKWRLDFEPSNDGYYRYIYFIRNLENGKTYVGQHTTKNLNDGYFGSGKYLRKAIVKYGKENFNFGIVCFVDLKEDLNEAEKFFIAIYETFGKRGYNLTEGGDSSGFKHSPETIKKLKEIKIGFRHSKESIDLMIMKRTGSKRSKETKERQSEGRYKYLDTLENKSWNVGLKGFESQETKQKRSTSLKNCGRVYNKGFGEPVKIECINVLTNEKTVFDSIRDLSKFLGVTYASNHVKKGHFRNRYILKRLENEKR